MFVGRAVRNKCTPKCPREPFLGSQQLSPPSCGGLGRVLGLCQAAARVSTGCIGASWKQGMAASKSIP